MYLYQRSENDNELTCVRYNDHRFQTVPHVHKSFEFAYILDGGIQVIVNGKVNLANARDAILILPYQIHYYNTANPVQTVVLNFSGEMVPAFTSMLGNSTVDSNAFQPGPLARLAIEEFLLQDRIQSVCDQKSLLYAICGSFWENTRLIHMNYPEASPAYRVIHYVAEHYRENITLKGISAELGYDYHYLSRAFTKTTKVSFRDFLNGHRIECARGLLRNTSMDIAAVAMECGFQNTRSFYRSFLDIMHQTPRQFRSEK